MTGLFSKIAAVVTAIALLGTNPGTAMKDLSDMLPQQETTEPSDNSGFVDSEVLSAPVDPIALCKSITIGWNLGNSLDATGYGSGSETSWGNPVTTKALIDTVRDAGFDAVRIPTTWFNHADDDLNVDEEWFSRVHEVVDYAYSEGMYVILNVHHENWNDPYESTYKETSRKLKNLWKQIASEFKDYGSRLIFEGMNEPRMIGSAEEWTGGTQESYDVINALYQAFVDTVRSSGGSNKDRTLVVSTYAQSVEKNAVSGLVVPKDDHVIVSLHIYAPWNFCGPDDTRADWGSDADKQELDTTFQYLDDTFVSKGIPVIIDETGCVNKNENTSARVAWFSYYLSTAKKHGIKCFIWDNNETKNGFGLLNRKDCTWYYPEIIEAIQNATK